MYHYAALQPSMTVLSGLYSCLLKAELPLPPSKAAHFHKARPH